MPDPRRRSKPHQDRNLTLLQGCSRLSDLPPKPTERPTAQRGPTYSERQITGVAVDGSMAGLSTIADAVRLTAAMTFPSGL
jgi:hypothetical protein